jgi:hypothetical protein
MSHFFLISIDRFYMFLKNYYSSLLAN